MSWLTIRRIYQVFFLALFVGLLYLASTGRLGSYPVSLFLEADPLLALGSALATQVVFRGLALALVVVLLTLLFGRVFCAWICPLGILNHALSALRWPRRRKDQIEANRWRPMYQTKYLVLVALLVLAIFGVLQVGVLDPIALLTRAMAITVLPGLQLVGLPLYAAQPSYAGGWLIGALLVLILLANRSVMRLWCRLLCPLGALLGMLAKFSLFRIHRDESRCINCNKCGHDCHGGCDPQGQLRVSDCVMCLNCLQDCPEPGALSYRFVPSTVTEAPAPDLSRRQTVAAIASGVALVPVLRTSHGVLSGASPSVIRPPGALAEVDFAAKCVKCGACMRVCPTSVIQPAALQAGFEGLWTPLMRYDVGFCSPDCTLCSQVCPTGAIAPITLADRRGKPPERRPLKTGTAFYDRGRCLPWAMGTPCIVCEEVCPVSPKAIWLQEAEVTRPDGSKIKVQQPYVDPERCIGCGTCQFRCPVGAKAAIRVSSVGESRSADNQMLLRSY